jgi:hypothetical protein
MIGNQRIVHFAKAEVCSVGRTNNAVGDVDSADLYRAEDFFEARHGVPCHYLTIY